MNEIEPTFAILKISSNDSLHCNYSAFHYHNRRRAFTFSKFNELESSSIDK